MHIQFKNIRLVRFGSFINESILNFDDYGPGVYYLKGKNKVNPALGSNGVGKSTLIKALRWCLEGKTGEGLKNPDIIPWSSKGKTEVELTIEIDNQEHKIKRTVNPNKISIDDREVGQEYIDKLIVIPFEIIPYTIILGQRQPLFFDLTASEKLKLFSEVLQLERWELRSKHAAELSNNLEKEITVKETEHEACLNAQGQALADFNSLKQQSSTWEANRAEQLSNAENDKKKLQKQIAAVMNERDTADLKLDRAETELKASPIESLRIHYSITLNEIVKYEEMLKTQVRHKAKYDTELISIQDCICPTCRQEIDREITKKLRIDLTKNIKICDDQITFLKKEIDLSKQVRDQTLEKFEIEDKASRKFKNDAEQARDILDRLLPKIANWEAEIKAIEKQLQTNETDSNPYTEQLQTLRRRRDQYKVTIEQTEKTIKTKAEYLERSKFWVKGFKDIKLLIVEEILQELEITTNSMCEEFGLINWQVKYDIERETKSGNIARGLNITILSPTNKNPVKWESWSGGEAQRLRLIGTFALSSVLLNHVGVTTNLEVTDEPTESLSREGVQDLVELLAQRAKQTNKSIFLIDHHTIESNHFVNTITVMKDKTGSAIILS